MLGFFRAVLNALKKFMAFLSNSLVWLWSWGVPRSGGTSGVVPGLAAYEEAAIDAPACDEDRLASSQPREQASQFASQVRELALRLAIAWPDQSILGEAESYILGAVYGPLCRMTPRELEDVAIMSDAGILQLFGSLGPQLDEGRVSSKKSLSCCDVKNARYGLRENVESDSQSLQPAAGHRAEQQASGISFIAAPHKHTGMIAANDVGEIRDEDNSYPRSTAALGR